MASRNQEELNLLEVISELQRGQDSTNSLEPIIQNETGSNVQILVQEIRGCFSRALTALDPSNQVSNQLRLPPVGGFRSRNEANSSTKVMRESPDDCYTWTEFRIKEIRGLKYPRCEYVCIHKEDLNCGATKRVQRMEGDPSMYEIAYHGEHTCANHEAASSS